MDFLAYRKTTAEGINQQMDNLLSDWNVYTKKVSPKILPVVEAFAEQCSGGKRLRGCLVKLGYELTGSAFTPEILKPAAAFEIFQTAILVHDDIIDQSPLRRGRPTLYKSLGDNHYGTSQAICLGDIGFFLAEKLITGSNFPEDKKNKAINFFIEMMLDTALGEVLDVELPHQSTEVKEEEIVTIFKLKTSMYTITGPLSLGAILGGADEELLEKLGRFGESLGIAFQIQDDILGVFGDEGIIGKSVTSDVEEGKSTLLFVYASQKADQKQRQVLDKYYGNGAITKKEHDRIKEIFVKSGALDYSRSQGLNYVVQAKKMIPKITQDPERQSLLGGLADFLVKREK